MGEKSAEQDVQRYRRLKFWACVARIENEPLLVRQSLHLSL